MKTIVLIDDDLDIHESIKMVLENAGYTFLGATNTESGMELINDAKPDLIILDVMMEQPDDGIVIAQELNAKGNTTPIIMLSSVSAVTGMKFGKDDEVFKVDDFIEKPISPDSLLEKVKFHLEKGAK